MRFCDLFDSYTDMALRNDAEAKEAIVKFKGNIPGRILQMEFDPSHSNKQGIKDGDKVYKLGLDVPSQTAFIEYFDNYNQGQPTMAIYVERTNKQVTVSGWQVDKRLLVRFAVVNGAVKKTVKLG